MPPIDPYRRERQLLWRNRVSEWRAEPGEAAFHFSALVLLAAFASMLLWQGWPRMLSTLAWLVGAWPLATALIALFLLAELQAAALRRQRARWARHWLIAQPIAEALRRHRLRVQVALRASLQIAIGDNLLKRPFLTKLMKLNKSFIVKRSVQGRDKLAASKQLSAYIRHCINTGQNVWIAQREGRAKNGIDETESAVLKMLSLSGRDNGEPLHCPTTGLADDTTTEHQAIRLTKDGTMVRSCPDRLRPGLRPPSRSLAGPS